MQKALRVMRVLLAAMTVCVCLILCWQAIDIYRVGNLPENFSSPGVRIHPVYSLPIVRERLTAVAPALLVYLTAVVVGLILQAVASEKPRPSVYREPEVTLRRLRQRVTAVPAAAMNEQSGRFRLWACAVAVAAVSAALALGYLLDGAHFTDWDLEKVVGGMMLHVAPWVALAFGALCAASHQAAKSVRREIDLLKAAPQQKPVSSADEAVKPVSPYLRAALYVAAVVLIVLGVMNGGLRDVLVKAINICTECIGLG